MAVTLITGDTVYWQNSGDSNQRVEVDPAPRDYPVEFDQHGSRQDFYVIPTDAREHVAAGTVDRELFNIPQLIRQGLADETSDELPVIVAFDQEPSTRQLMRDADALPAVGNPTVIKTMNAAGVAINRDEAGSFRQAVLGLTEPDGTARTTDPRGLGMAVERILLDRALKIDLAESVPQIGAPKAWQAGYTGDGVTVAVLDTGIDSTHPDLAGQVVAAENFTDEPDATDTHGHGTHVASTIAGTGAASSGARTGVAPGADLLNGKVCRPTPDGQGICQTSWIMAGMEWATSQGADIVNMSLGGGPTNGTDPLAQMVNQLSVDTNTLFVTSAGNSGPRAQTVGSPGTADAALAVGAVDKSNQLTRFSSRGPRMGDHAVKPEITAPGFGIIAARASGTSAGSPVDNQYTSINGTSMASPHVAGAAALLAQAQPDLGWAQLKDALVSTSTDIGRLWWEGGVGRVDVPAALDSPIHATGTVNLGHVTDHAEQSIAYANRSDTDITLSLEAVVVDSSGQDLDVAHLSADTLTVPANGQATATVTIDVTEVPNRDNLFGGGVIIAHGDGVNVRTGIGFGPIRHPLTIEVLDSHGNRIGTPDAGDVDVHLDHDTYDPAKPIGNPGYTFSTSNGIATEQLPAGTYSIRAVINENTPGTGKPIRGNMLIKTDVVIEAGTRITLDSRDAVPVQVTVPRVVDKRNHTVSVIRQRANLGPAAEATLLAGGPNRQMYVTPTPPSHLGSQALFVHWVLAAPLPVHPLPGPLGAACTNPTNPIPFRCYTDAPAYAYNLPFVYENGVPDNLHEKVTRGDLVEVPTRFHSDQPNDVLLQHQFEAYTPFPCGFGCGGDHTRMWIKPGTVIEYFPADDRFTWIRRASLNHWPGSEPLATSTSMQISGDHFPNSEAGARRVEERWWEAPMRVGAVDIREEFIRGPRLFPRSASASRGGVTGDQFVPGHQIMDNTRGHLAGVGPESATSASWRMWNLITGAELEGVEFDPQNNPNIPAFTLAAEEATYRLQQTSGTTDMADGLIRTGPALTTWTFTSHSGDEPAPAGYRCPLPTPDGMTQDCQIQPLIQLEYQLGLDIHNQAPAGRAHRFTILAGHHSRAVHRSAVTSLRVQASFDDGDTWEEARVLGKPLNTVDTGGLLPAPTPYQQFRVILKHAPLYRSNGYVSLRVQATDAGGGTVAQTIHRAYILK